MTFQSLELHPNILKGVRSAGYDTPTPIQAQAIPIARAGSDMIGCAQTGTGKTAAFVLPLLHTLMTSPSAGGRNRTVRALVVTPTRELALQVEESARTYSEYTNLRSLAVFGGVSIGKQQQGLRRGVDLVVATPGRLLDLMDRGDLDLSHVEVLVLDEADRMLDMGFIRDIRKIVREVPRERQTLLFSATMPREVQELADSITMNPQVVEIGRRRNPAETVSQRVCPIAYDQKLGLLVHVLETENVESVIVFSRTKRRADRIMKQLNRRGFSATVMHSNRSQNQRQRALDGFKDGRFQILVATDIAARGIDVDGISHVINYDTPNQAEDYIHRIGRTGRAQTSGEAITFVAADEQDYLHAIERHTGRPIERQTYEGFSTEPATPHPNSGGQNTNGSRSRNGGSRNGGQGGSRNGGKRRRGGRSRSRR